MIRLQLFFSTIELSIGNLHLAEIQKITFEELKGKSGIYGFICKTTNKLYIGSSINLNMRLNNHINGSQSNILLQNAINKYELQNFIFIIFEYCEPKELISREQFYIDTLEPEYNILKVAGNSLGYRHSEESLVKMSEALKGRTFSAETIVKFSGRTHSEETKALISQAMIGKNLGKNLGKTHSEESKALMSLAKSGYNNPMTKKVFVYILDSDSNALILHKSFFSLTDATKHFNCSRQTISKYLDKNKLYKNQWLLYTSEK